MMRRVGIFLSYLLVFLLLCVVLLPKIRLYYLAETLLQEQKVTISGEVPSDSGVVFNLSGGELYLDNLKVADLGEVSVLILLVYNTVTMNNVELDTEMTQFLPQEIEMCTLSHHLLAPMQLSFTCNGAFGDANGSIALSERKIFASVSPSQALLQSKPFWLRKAKKSSDGRYGYEASF